MYGVPSDEIDKIEFQYQRSRNEGKGNVSQISIPLERKNYLTTDFPLFVLDLALKLLSFILSKFSF